MENPITNYLVISSGTATELNDKINNAISQGWIPHGGISTCFNHPGKNSTSNGNVQFTQAMVKFFARIRPE